MDCTKPGSPLLWHLSDTGVQCILVRSLHPLMKKFGPSFVWISSHCVSSVTHIKTHHVTQKDVI
jgi:hypothetical protein